ncbi:hypothetical protein ADUPG1_009987 [Aduncisulcus paluster]|uniref:Uncharacterized protein n=1 Tax=Aduncisulcus paluster TaxID=2918883 RepID=A0ABQ5KXG4_9EUKA|nr:hypothetical protein ADUPG1_009987 [Aduncisulcus paluster]
MLEVRKPMVGNGSENGHPVLSSSRTLFVDHFKNFLVVKTFIVVTIPDSALQQYLCSLFDEPSNCILQQEDLENLTIKYIDIEGLGISNLEGIQYLAQSTSLIATGNPISNLDALITMDNLIRLSFGPTDESFDLFPISQLYIPNFNIYGPIPYVNLSLIREFPDICNYCFTIHNVENFDFSSLVGISPTQIALFDMYISDSNTELISQYVCQDNFNMQNVSFESTLPLPFQAESVNLIDINVSDLSCLISVSSLNTVSITSTGSSPLYYGKLSSLPPSITSFSAEYVDYPSFIEDISAALPHLETLVMMDMDCDLSNLNQEYFSDLNLEALTLKNLGIHRFSFGDSKHLEELTISNNPLEFDSISFLQDIPESLRTLRLVSVGLSAFPLDSFLPSGHTFTLIDLSENIMSDLNTLGLEYDGIVRFVILFGNYFNYSEDIDSIIEYLKSNRFPHTNFKGLSDKEYYEHDGHNNGQQHSNQCDRLPSFFANESCRLVTKKNNHKHQWVIDCAYGCYHEQHDKTTCSCDDTHRNECIECWNDGKGCKKTSASSSSVKCIHIGNESVGPMKGAYIYVNDDYSSPFLLFTFTDCDGKKTFKKYEFTEPKHDYEWHFLPIDLDNVVLCEIEGKGRWDKKNCRDFYIYSLVFTIPEESEIIEQISLLPWK